ncbi:MAG: signal peptide peptidase SppA [Planctomycetes bacterium]|nr:signal peptide peptidase SppA [Planctomycetota bacterium]
MNSSSSGPVPTPAGSQSLPPIRAVPAPSQASVPPNANRPIVVYAVGTFQRWMGRLGWVGFLGCLLIVLVQWASLAQYFDNSGGIYESFHSGSTSSQDKVAIIDISGVIVDGDGFVKRQIERIEADEAVRAIVLRVNSPGGTVTGSDYIHHYLTKLRKQKPQIPLVVSMGSLAASGGYYVSMAVGHQEKVLFAEPTCTTGSIGVIIPHYDVSKLMERFDVRDDSISSHPRKQMLSMTRPLENEERQLVQSYVDESYERFLEIVRDGRKVFADNPDALKQLATGEIFSAVQAKKHGLVDEIGFLDDAIERACEIAKLDAKQVRVVRFRRPEPLLPIPGFAQAPESRSELALLFELSTPRAYYLATSLPTLITSRRAD